MKKWSNREIENLIDVIFEIDNKKDLKNFLRDVCTIKELRSISMRWKAAKMLSQKIPYREIAKATGLSTTTITRVSTWLEYGEGGYNKQLDNLGKQ